MCSNETCHKFFLALANPTRLAILETLQNGSRNVAEISETLNCEQSMISHNLKTLEECALVFSERRGKERVYRSNKEVIEPLFEVVCLHANKYCPNERVCMSAKGLEQFKKEEAAKPLYLNPKK